MGIFDIFTNKNAQDAANDQIAGLQHGLSSATGALNTGYGNATSALNTGAGNASSLLSQYFGNAGQNLATNYAGALQPFLQNYGQAQSGVNALSNVLGLNGPSGNASAMTALQNTPGYQFQLQQGDNALNARAAATGQLASGNEALALSNYNQGLASTTYNNYVNQLMPFLQSSNTNAAGIANVYTGLGSGQANINTGLGSGLANIASNLGTGTAGLDTSLAGSLAGLNWQAATGQGNAQANADLANNQASANIWNAIGSAASMAMGMPGMGGSFNFQSPGSSIPGSFGPTSVGGANGPTPLSGGSFLGSIFSDVALKENIEPVGELYDGTNVYRYNYKGDETPRIGVMAQEIEQRRPDAVTEIGGFKAVDYGKATDLAASLARFVGDNVINLDDYRENLDSGYASDLARFLDAA